MLWWLAIKQSCLKLTITFELLKNSKQNFLIVYFFRDPGDAILAVTGGSLRQFQVLGVRRLFNLCLYNKYIIDYNTIILFHVKSV